jgi:hypothetical protein
VIHSCAPQTNVKFCFREYFRTKSAFLLEDTAAVVVVVGAGGAATTTGGCAGAAATDDGMWGVALDNSCKRRSKSATASSGVGGLILVSLLVAADATPSLLLSLGLDIIMMARAVIGSKECIDQLLNLACDVHPTPKNLNSNWKYSTTAFSMFNTLLFHHTQSNLSKVGAMQLFYCVPKRPSKGHRCERAVFFWSGCSHV